MSEVRFSEDRIVCIAVPYSRGWRATVDGEPAKIYKMNDLFMGVEVSKGTHSLTLKYCTEGLKCGVFISLFTLLLMIVIFLRNCSEITHYNRG